jgi:hypothetical protein
MKLKIFMAFTLYTKPTIQLVFDVQTFLPYIFKTYLALIAKAHFLTD